MILFCNTYITEKNALNNWNYRKEIPRQNLKSFSNFDIFKYSLASLAVAYPWSKVILKISLDDIYKPRQKELEDFIKEEFKNSNLILEWNRNEYQNDWKKDYELLDDNLIWFYCNHDHIFFDSDTQYLKKLVSLFNNENNVSILFSHFPEAIRTIKQDLYPNPTNYISSTYKIHDNYLSVEANAFDSIQIVTKDLYYKWWFEGEFNHIRLPRPDFFGIGLAEIKPVPIHKVVIPIKEICRHFDGYQHIPIQITNNQCPAIEIPVGFFEKNIKIRYGYDDYKEGWVNINPKNSNYYAHDKSGTDYKFTLEDLPLVWRNRISIVDSNSNINEEEMIQYRLKAVLEMLYTSEYFTIDDEVRDKILNEYLKSYPQYQIND